MNPPIHSYGHGQFCCYCGIDGDDEVPGVPCPQTLSKPLTDKEMAPYNALCKLAEDIGSIAQQLEWGADLNDVMREINEAADEHRKRTTSARPSDE